MSKNKTIIVPAVLAEQLREWADKLDCVGARDEILMRGIIAGMQQVADDLLPLETCHRWVELTRTWFEDREYIDVGKGAPKGVLGMWAQQIQAEFENCNVFREDADVPILVLDPRATLTTTEDGETVAKFKGELRFRYGDQGVSFSCDADLIQNIFYDEGGVAGDFAIIYDRD